MTSRRYVALRVRTVGGLAAHVVGRRRGSPIDAAILDLLGPEFIGTDPGDILGRVEDFHRLTIALERDGVLGRAWSLLELAMQGLRAAAQGVPVWQLFGGSARELPVQLVEGYALSNESDESFARRLIMRFSEGYRALKVEGAHYQNWRTLARRLELTRREAPDCRLVVDFAWSWRAAREHVDALAALGELGVDWIEDAFPLHAVDQYLLAGKLTRAPIGCGDDGHAGGGSDGLRGGRCIAGRTVGCHRARRVLGRTAPDANAGTAAAPRVAARFSRNSPACGAGGDGGGPHRNVSPGARIPTGRNFT